jgi:hypothetical protein
LLSCALLERLRISTENFIGIFDFESKNLEVPDLAETRVKAHWSSIERLNSSYLCPDGSCVLYRGRSERGRNNHVELVDSASGKIIKILEPEKYGVTTFNYAFSQAGEKIYIVVI